MGHERLRARQDVWMKQNALLKGTVRLSLIGKLIIGLNNLREVKE